MKAITAEYFGPRERNGSRIVARDADGNRVYSSVDVRLRIEENVDQTVIKLCQKMKWSGIMVRGRIGLLWVYVWLDENEMLEVPK